MEKENWQKHYDALYDIHRLASTYTHTYKTGKNKKIRSEAERNLQMQIRGCQFYFKNNHEVYILASGGENRSDYDRSDYMHEFVQYRYFVDDLWTLLLQIESILKPDAQS